MLLLTRYLLLSVCGFPRLSNTPIACFYNVWCLNYLKHLAAVLQEGQMGKLLMARQVQHGHMGIWAALPIWSVHVYTWIHVKGNVGLNFLSSVFPISSLYLPHVCDWIWKLNQSTVLRSNYCVAVTSVLQFLTSKNLWNKTLLLFHSQWRYHCMLKRKAEVLEYYSDWGHKSIIQDHIVVMPIVSIATFSQESQGSLQVFMN